MSIINCVISFFKKGKSFFGVCLFHFNGICNQNQLTFSWRTGKSTSYHADYLISNVSRKREFDEKIQG